MKGYELRMELDEETAKPISELATELGLSESETERRFEYLQQFGVAERTSEGLRDTGHRDEFKR
jgi:DNA-binding Lrp family transcriptional regulator